MTHQLFIFGGCRLLLLAGEPGGDVFHVFIGEGGSHAGHDRIVTHRRLVADRLEILQLFVNVFFNLAGQNRVCGNLTVAIGAVAGNTDGFSDYLSLGRVSFCCRFLGSVGDETGSKKNCHCRCTDHFELLVRVFGRFGRNGGYKPVILYQFSARLAGLPSFLCLCSNRPFF